MLISVWPHPPPPHTHLPPTCHTVQTFLFVVQFLPLFSHQTGFVSLPTPHVLPPTPPPLLRIESGFDCTTELQICHFIYVSTIRNWCVLPPFVHWGATLPCFRGLTVPTKLEDSRYNVGLRNCVIVKLQWFIYFSFRSTKKKSIFWLTTDNFFFSETLFSFFSFRFFSGALILFCVRLFRLTLSEELLCNGDSAGVFRDSVAVTRDSSRLKNGGSGHVSPETTTKTKKHIQPCPPLPERAQNWTLQKLLQTIDWPLTPDFCFC